MKKTRTRFAVLLLILMAVPQYSPAQKTITGYNFEHGVVAWRPGQMYGWPGIVQVKGEELLVSASERKLHVDPSGREVVMRSTDGGKTWGLPMEIFDSELDDRDQNLLSMPDGSIIATWFISEHFTKPGSVREAWRARAERVTERMRDELLGGWLLHSGDGGYTWEEQPTRIPAGMHAGPSVLSDGRIIYLGPAKLSDKLMNRGYRMEVNISGDAGKSWETVAEIPCDMHGNPPRPYLDENHVLEVSPGHLVAMFRNENPDDRFLYQSDSHDGGRTWTHARRTAIWGHPPHLVRLANGIILCSSGHRREPFSIRAVASYDHGKTWDTGNPITIFEWGPRLDMGYPVTLEISPGQLITVYYGTRAIRNPSGGSKEIQGILCTRWQYR